MYKQNQNTFMEKLYIMLVLFKNGILVNIFSGTIRYFNYCPRCFCKELKLMRHGITIGVENKEFMSDTSNNSVLSLNGKNQIRNNIKEVHNFTPDIILVAPLERTRETYNIIKAVYTVEALELESMRGINNSVWAGKTFEMLDDNDLYIFLNRECKHNIFTKTYNGDSWGDVLVRCVKVLNEINKRYQDKKVLLVSQGSILQGLKIVLHYGKLPWEDYSAMKMFSVSKYRKNADYGRILTVFSRR